MTMSAHSAALGSYHHFLHGPTETDQDPVVTIEQAAREHLGAGATEDEVTALADGYRAHINGLLDGTGIVMHGQDFYLGVYADAHDVEQANEVVRNALDATDLATVEPATPEPEPAIVVTAADLFALHHARDRFATPPVLAVQAGQVRPFPEDVAQHDDTIGKVVITAAELAQATGGGITEHAAVQLGEKLTRELADGTR